MIVVKQKSNNLSLSALIQHGLESWASMTHHLPHTEERSHLTETPHIRKRVVSDVRLEPATALNFLHRFLLSHPVYQRAYIFFSLYPKPDNCGFSPFPVKRIVLPRLSLSFQVTQSNLYSR